MEVVVYASCGRNLLKKKTTTPRRIYRQMVCAKEK